MYSKLVLHKIVLALALGAMAAALPAAWAAPRYTILHGFTGGTDGGNLTGSLTLGGNGNVYGATALDTIFELSPRPRGRWHFQVLLTLTDGSGANGGLWLDPVGNLYGTTQACCPIQGEVFEVSLEPGGWKETVIHRFSHSEHTGDAWDGPIMDKAGNLYGTAGSAYELSPGSGGWKFTNLHEFLGKNGDGVDPYAGPIMDALGNLYGTTDRGGAYKAGIAYELAPASKGWKEHILHSFPAFPNDGEVPALGALALDANGSLYGATRQGGRHTCVDVGCGTIFRLSRDTGGHWKETILYNFAGGAEGNGPGGSVALDKAGNLYGTTIYGGSGCDCGVVYKLAPSKSGKWIYTVLHTFDGSDGAQPDANLILDDKGNLYGTTITGGPGGVGVAFELTP